MVSIGLGTGRKDVLCLEIPQTVVAALQRAWHHCLIPQHPDSVSVFFQMPGKHLFPNIMCLLLKLLLGMACMPATMAHGMGMADSKSQFNSSTYLQLLNKVVSLVNFHLNNYRQLYWFRHY